MGNLEKAYFTQILPDNVRYYDGLVRTTMYGAYGKPITGPHLPEVFLTEAEKRNVSDFAVKHCLREFKHVFLFECGPGSGQSPLTPARAEALAHALVKYHPEVVFLMSSHETLVRPSASSGRCILPHLQGKCRLGPPLHRINRLLQRNYVVDHIDRRKGIADVANSHEIN